MEYFLEFLSNEVHFKYVGSAYFIAFFVILLLMLLSIIRTKKYEREHKRFENKNEGQI